MKIECTSTALRRYLSNPYKVGRYQCIAQRSSNIFVRCEKACIDYYGITLKCEVLQEAVKKGDPICVLENKPKNLLKQLAFYRKCKEININKDLYAYAELLAKQLAELPKQDSVGRPALRKSNCKKAWVPWCIEIDGKRVRGRSRCLVARRNLEAGEPLLYEYDSKRLKKKLMKLYPVFFQAGERCFRPKRPINCPVIVNGKLVNFMDLKNKFVQFELDERLEAYEPGSSNARKVVLKGNGPYEVVEIIDPEIDHRCKPSARSRAGSGASHSAGTSRSPR